MATVGEETTAWLKEQCVLLSAKHQLLHSALPLKLDVAMEWTQMGAGRVTIACLKDILVHHRVIRHLHLIVMVKK